jgi:hypothetical protein
VHPVGNLVRRGDDDAREARRRQPGAVLGERGCPGDAAHLAAALEPLGRGDADRTLRQAGDIRVPGRAEAARRELGWIAVGDLLA